MLIIILILILITSLFYLPILLNPAILVARGNDLTEFFWPIFDFTKHTLITFHQLPFWNNLFFSGTPLLPDPQAPIFYLPNIIFLFFTSMDSGFVVSVFLHILASGVGMYLLSKHGFKFSKTVSLFCSFVYITSPKLSGYIEAGHFGLIASWAWLPFVFLSVLLLVRKQNLTRSLFLAVTLAGVFYTHVLIFAIATTASSALYLYLAPKKIKYLIISGIFCFGIIAIAFLPQLSWQGQTTRNLLLKDPDVYPKWLGVKDFLKASISPMIFGPKFIWNLDTEKTIGVGFFVSLLALFGWIRLKFRQKFLILTILCVITLVSLNNISPFYDFLIKQNWYILLRVSTRFWFLVVFITTFLAGYGLEKLLKNKKLKFLTIVIAILAVTELLLTSWTKILKPISTNQDLAPNEVYTFLSKDKSQFRVFCLTHCLSQKESELYNLQLADGYGTLQQQNYYVESEQLAQAFYRNRYTLAIPPFEIYKYENLQPYTPNLSALNIKYVISNHLLKDKNLILVKEYGKFLIYENKINQSRANYPITRYTPNFITIDTSSQISPKLTLSEVYNPDWHAYANGDKEIKINETPDKTREVDIDKDTKFVEFVYDPLSFRIGLIITLTIVISIGLAIFPFHFFTKKKNNSKN